ncbi:14956_t:CDS:2, partial [Gigaspora margarita]
MSLSLLLTTILKHYTEGPPGKSWDLKFHLSVAALKNNDGMQKLPIEEARKQFDQYIGQIKSPSNVVVKEVVLDERYRQKSRIYLEKGLKQYEDVLDEKWKEPSDRLHGEWVYTKEESKNNEFDKVILHMHGGGYFLGTPKSERTLTAICSEHTKTRVLSIDYRLSPENQFPAALCDSVAAYLYLINPESDAGFKPINPKKIVFLGGSAGGGLILATLLFLRDAGLPLPGGAVALSPWVDLTHSMPSFLDAEIDKADIVPKILGFRKIGPSSPIADESIANAKALSDKIAQKKPNILFTFSKHSQIAFERCCNFINRVISIEGENTSMIDLFKEDVASSSISISPSFIAMRIGTNGEIKELNEADRDCLKWDKIGVVPKE